MLFSAPLHFYPRVSLFFRKIFTLPLSGPHHGSIRTTIIQNLRRLRRFSDGRHGRGSRVEGRESRVESPLWLRLRCSRSIRVYPWFSFFLPQMNTDSHRWEKPLFGCGSEPRGVSVVKTFFGDSQSSPRPVLAFCQRSGQKEAAEDAWRERPFPARYPKNG